MSTESLPFNMDTLEKMIHANQLMSEALTELLIQKKQEEQKQKEEVWITTKEASRIASLTGGGVRYLINTGQLKWKRNGSRYLILKDSLLGYLRKE